MVNKNAALVALVIFAAGCGLETRTYVMTKDRVGLDQNSGNGGCVMGKCPPAPAPKETTRKVYVLELTRPVPESEVRKIEETAVNVITSPPAASPAPSNAAPAETASAAASAAPSQPVVPVVGELPGTAAPAAAEANAPAQVSPASAEATSYTVQKDDTLQKISKKVYGTYAKWYKIYKANKDKISNPNVLKPGTVLNIPASK
jgi:nucleoid-associated protein YgaU